MFAAATATASATAGFGAAPAICRRGGEVSVRPAAVAGAEAVSARARSAVGGVSAAERVGAAGPPARADR